MILAIDIGNTTTNFGVFERGRLRANFSIATQPSGTPDEVALHLKALAKSRQLDLRQAKQIVLCSVVPRMSAVLIQALRWLEMAPVRMVGQDLPVPLRNRYRYPEQVGQDRLVGAFAAREAFNTDCIVADFGTAITIDVVTKAGEYLGGVIAPGLEISLEALASRTALLPKVELGEPPELLGRDTANSIRSGLLYGCVALCDGLVTQLKQRYAPKATVVATGGSAKLIVAHSATIEQFKPYLVLEGLHQLLQNKKTRRLRPPSQIT
jgi:type III pantothenate kinase